MPLTIRKCLGCGAPLKGLQCEYCGIEHEDPDYQKPVESCYDKTEAYINSFNMGVTTSNELKQQLGFTDEQISVANCLLAQDQAHRMMRMAEMILESEIPDPGEPD